MFRTFLKIAGRNSLRHKLYTTINILGLSLGICTCIVIYIITSHELSYDTFHPGKESIYRVMGDVTESTGDKLHFAKVPPAVSTNGQSELRGLDAMAAIIPYQAKITVPAAGDNPDNYYESRKEGTHYITTAVTEPVYFDIFRYEWLAGNKTTALAAPFSVVLTDSRARLYFGSVPYGNMIGKKLVYGDSLVVRVTGIIKQWEENTDLLFSDFISFSTLRNSFLRDQIHLDSWKQNAMAAWVFVKQASGMAHDQLNTQLAAMVKRHADPGTNLSLWLEPLSAIHFNAAVIENPVRTAHLPTLYGLMGIALFIVILAIINFINLSTVQSIRRAKEVGIRKVLGSSRTSLALQFLCETTILTLLSLAIAVSLVNPVLSWFGSFIPDGVTFYLFKPSTLLFLLLLVIITSLLAGSYPALLLTSQLPVVSLKGTGVQRGNEKWLLRKGLIVFQFSISLVFIIGSMVITKQLNYIRQKDLGFSADAIITIDTPRGDSLSKIRILAQKIDQLPGVGKTALQWLSPMTENPREMKLKFKNTDEKDFWVKQVAGDENYIPVYGIKLLAGRNLAKSDTVKELVINESLARLMHNKNPEEAIGKNLYWNDKPYPIAGVVADFHTNSLHDPITPLCIINRPEREGSIAVKLITQGKEPGMIKAIIDRIASAWKQIYPAGAFNYSFYDESLALLYKKDRQTGTLINTSMLITIFISCIGLFGLALFTAEKKAREISIRKIAGASVTDITVMLSRDFVTLVIIALFVASPVAWYFMNRWLQNFTYRIAIGWWVFVLAGMAAVVIALATVSVQAIRAARVNPVKNLRAE